MSEEKYAEFEPDLDGCITECLMDSFYGCLANSSICKYSLATGITGASCKHSIKVISSRI